MAILRSLQYPLSLRNGGLATTEDFEVLRQSIYSVLETRPFERVLRTEFGTPNYVFETVQDPSVICEQIRISLTTQIPEVDSFSIAGQINEDGVMNVRIEWTADNIVQPPIQYQLAF